MNKFREDLGKMKGMRAGEVVEHIWSYYRFHLLVLVISILIFLLHAIAGPKVETVFSAILVDTGAGEEVTERLTSDFGAVLNLDERSQRVTFDTTSVLGDNAVTALQMLVMRVIAGEADVFLCNTDIVNYLLKSGALSDLAEILPEKTLEQWNGLLIYVDADALAAWTEANNAGDFQEVDLISDSPEGMSRPVPVGMDVTEACRTALGRAEDTGKLYCVASVTTTHPESIAGFLDYLRSTGSP